MVVLALGCDRATRPVTPYPTIAINTPSASGEYTTPVVSVDIGGTVSRVASIRWNDSGNSSTGFASITYVGDAGSWTAHIPALVLGSNPIAVYADADGRGRTIGTAAIRIVYDPSLDHEPPVIHITTPSSSGLFEALVTPIVVGGTASDNSGDFGVRWRNKLTGESAIATGTGNWQASVALAAGDNVIVATAIDLAGHSARDSILVTYTPPGPRSW
jgi:hypothetical protein